MKPSLKFPEETSLWSRTAELPLELPRLEGDLRAEVVIVGAGYSGLSAAHALQKRGIDAVVLEAHRVGWGGSGRNGGVVAGKFRVSFPAVAKLHGLEVARYLHRLSHESVDAVEQLIEELGIQYAQLEMTGNLRCAHTEEAHRALVAEVDWLRTQLGDRALSVLSRVEGEHEIGSRSYFGGVLNHHAGTIHPLNYARGLAAGLAARKVRLFEDSPVESIEDQAGGVLVKTPTGAVHAKQILIATDAYSDLHPSTRRVKTAVIPFRSAVIATSRLPESLAVKLLVEHRSYSETRRMMKWFRKTNGRLIFGGRGAFGGTGASSAYDALRRAMTKTFPELEAVDIEFNWSGFVGMTLDQLPHVGRIDKRTCLCVGFNGSGIAMASLLGQQAAAFVAGEAPNVSILDAKHLKTVPFYPLRAPGIRMVAGWYQFLDAIGR
jgi:gamma-glutamylputrescine oxidase